jgi:hypothetical protein
VGRTFIVSVVQPRGTVVGEECQICLEEYGGGQRLAVLDCLCKFHADCVERWMERGHGCPLHSI